MSEYETKNAVIRGASLSIDDHGLLTASLDLDYGGSCQGFGGYVLYLPREFKNGGIEKTGNVCGHFVWRCLEIAGVTEWSQLKGKTIRVRSSHRDIQAIGHIVKDDWFSPRNDFKDTP